MKWRARSTDRAPVPSLTAGIHLAALWALAVVQPLLDVLGGTGELFVAQRVDGVALLVVLVLFTALPPAVMLGLESLAGRAGPRYRRALHLAFVLALGTAFGVVAVNSIESVSSPALVAVGATAFGGLATLAYARRGPVRMFVSALAPAPLIVLVAFAFSPPIRALWPPGEDAAAAPAREAATPVVLVVLDELPSSSLLDEAGRLDAERYPGFARLASRSTTYATAVAPAHFTLAAVPSIFTGTFTTKSTPPLASEHPGNLFTLLAGSHRLHVSEHATQLCDPRLCPSDEALLRRMAELGYALSLAYLHVLKPRGLAFEPPTIGRSWAEAIASEDPRDPFDARGASANELSRHQREQFERFIGGIRRPRPGARPPLHVLHASLVHQPWRYLPSGAAYAPVQGRPPGLGPPPELRWTRDASLVDHSWQRHLLETELADRLIDRTIDRLRAVGLYERSLVVVTADHGISFRPGLQARGLEAGNAADVAVVPLFVKAPGQRRARRVERPVQTLDILPTVAATLGIRVPWRLDGRPLSDDAPSRRPRFFAAERGLVRLDVDRLLRDRRETLRRQTKRFGSGRASLYGLGPRHELVGRRAAELEIVAPAESGPRATIDDKSYFLTGPIGDRFIPALVAGSVSRAGSGAAALAIEVNGAIAATTTTFPDKGDTRFSVMVPPRTLRAGSNQVRVLRIARGGRLTVLGSVP